VEGLGIWLLLILAGYVFGRRAESSHYRSIEKRERALEALPATNLRIAPEHDARGVLTRSELVHGSVVISVDFFKTVMAGIRGIFGGRVRSYETLVDRARREAVLRMKESCPGAHQIINLRLETASISGRSGRGVGSVEVLAYGTALYFSPSTEAGHRKDLFSSELAMEPKL